MLGVAPHGPGEMALDAGHEFVPLGQYLAGDQDAAQVVDGLGVATAHVAGKAVQILVGRRSSGGGVGKEPGGVGIADPVQYGPRLVAVGQRGPHGLEPAARRCGHGVEAGVELLVEGAAVTQPSHHGRTAGFHSAGRHTGRCFPHTGRRRGGHPAGRSAPGSARTPGRCRERFGPGGSRACRPGRAAGRRTPRRWRRTGHGALTAGACMWCTSPGRTLCRTLSRTGSRRFGDVGTARTSGVRVSSEAVSSPANTAAPVSRCTRHPARCVSPSRRGTATPGWTSLSNRSTSCGQRALRRSRRGLPLLPRRGEGLLGHPLRPPPGRHGTAHRRLARGSRPGSLRRIVLLRRPGPLPARERDPGLRPDHATLPPIGAHSRPWPPTETPDSPSEALSHTGIEAARDEAFRVLRKDR